MLADRGDVETFAAVLNYCSRIVLHAQYHESANFFDSVNIRYQYEEHSFGETQRGDL